MSHFFRQATVFTLLILVLLTNVYAQSAATTKPSEADSPVVLRVDPLLLAEAAEAWKLIASPRNPIWPGWDASTTPLLIYLPGQQDVLINHPHPPQGFVPYPALTGFPGAKVAIKNGPTLIDADGQNTSTDVAGVRTLVVADTLSNLRSRISGLLEDPRPATEKVRTLDFSDFATDPYDQLEVVVHEAFHVYQNRQAPDKGANEMALVKYPVLSVENNVGFAQEGAALAEALRAHDDASFRRAALRWLAVRKDRRSAMAPKLAESAVEYEDGCEFNEGLAKYTGYRLFQVLEGRTPGPALLLAQGFHGYADLAPRREQLVDRMYKHMTGAVVVNNDPYGAAPLRMRLYYSGMAIGVMLDKLDPAWKKRIFAPNVSLTSLVEAALKPSPAALDAALKEARSDPGYASLVEQKTKLAAEGKGRAEAVLHDIEHGPGTGVIVDFSKLESPKVSMNFTPFGITRIDDQRILFSQLPVKVVFGNDGEVKQKLAVPLLRDGGKKLVEFRLPSATDRTELEKAVSSLHPDAAGTVAGLAIEVSGVAIKAPKAQVHWVGDDLVVVLLPATEKKGP